MEIWKIGGSCLLGAASYQNIADLVGRRPKPKGIVVSAMCKATDFLDGLIRGQSKHPEEFLDRHRSVWRQLGGTIEDFEAMETTLMANLTKDEEFSASDRDGVLAWGDEFSAQALVLALGQKALPCQYVSAGALGLVTDDTFGQARPVADVHTRIRRAMENLEGLIVAPGFVGVTEKGQSTTLGRNTGDYSAALVAAAWDSSDLRVFASARGILSADPARVPDARPIDEMRYDEAAEMVHAGAPVMHPLALATMRSAGAKTYMENLDHANHDVTCIATETSKPKNSFRAIPHRAGLSLVEMHPLPGVGGQRVLGEVLGVLQEQAVAVDMSSASESTAFLAVQAGPHVAAILDGFSDRATIDIQPGFSSVSLVGLGVTEERGISSRALAILTEAGIFPKFMNEGGQSPRVSFLVTETDLDQALQLLHDAVIAPN